MIILKGDQASKDSYQEITEINQIKKNKNYLIKSDMLSKIDFNTLLGKNLKIGVKINSDFSVNEIVEFLIFFSLIEIEFLTFKDGRPFTMAKDLRKIFRFKGELRASGHILPDQHVFLLRCGFDSVRIAKDEKQTWITIYENDPGLKYQSD
mgnify:FL=1